MSKHSIAARGTELWDEVQAKRATGEPGPAEIAAREWDALSPDEQVAATRAGTRLWNEVTVRHENPELEL